MNMPTVVLPPVPVRFRVPLPGWVIPAWCRLNRSVAGVPCADPEPQLCTQGTTVAKDYGGDHIGGYFTVLTATFDRVTYPG